VRSYATFDSILILILSAITRGTALVALAKLNLYPGP